MLLLPRTAIICFSLFCVLDQHTQCIRSAPFFLSFFFTPTCIPLPSVINTYLSIPSPFLLFFLATARHNIRLISYPFHSLSFDLDLSIFFFRVMNTPRHRICRSRKRAALEKERERDRQKTSQSDIQRKYFPFIPSLENHCSATYAFRPCVVVVMERVDNK